MSFTEYTVTIFDRNSGNGREIMVHLNEKGKMIRAYGYVRELPDSWLAKKQGTTNDLFWDIKPSALKPYMGEIEAQIEEEKIREANQD